MENKSIINIDSKEQIFIIFQEIKRLVNDDDKFVRFRFFNNITKIFEEDYKKFYILIHDGLESTELKCLKENESFYLSRDYKLVQATELVRDIKLNKIIDKHVI